MRGLSISLAILLAGAFHAGSAQAPRFSHEKPTAGDLTRISPSEALRRDMRKLWSDHAFWTRDYVIAAINGTPDAEAAAKRLLRNQENIGNAVATYYGREAGDKLTALLKEHILIAADLVKAAVAHEQTKFDDLDRKWSRNGEDIADFLAKANPNWSWAGLVDMMKIHLATTKQEVTARLNGNWEEDVKAFDVVYDHILKMSDSLSDGIIKQFPAKFSGPAS